MATKKRIWYCGCTYHITARGNHRNDIFRDDADYGMYLIMMKECLKYYKEYNYEFICYCLMTNHVHLLIRANDKEVGHLIQRLHSMYAVYFNTKYNYVGHLFQDKYFAEEIKDSTQILEASAYIHLNPVRARMVEQPEQYKHSSFLMIIGIEEEKLISSNRILGHFKEEMKRELYKKYVEGKMKKTKMKSVGKVAE
jgi:putative transposase